MPRFPLTAAALEHEADVLIERLLGHPHMRHHRKDDLMATVQQLKDGLDGLKNSVDALVGKVGQSSGISEADLDPVLTEIGEMRTAVDAVVSVDRPAGAAPSPIVQAS